MSTAVMPATVHIKRRHLVGLLVATVAATATITATLSAVTSDAISPRSEVAARTREEVLASLSPDTRRYVEGVEALSPLERAAAYGSDPFGAIEMTPRDREFVSG